MAAQGQSFFNATGDSDAFTGSIPFPSDSTNITEVGGTTLTTGTGATYSSETVWNWGLQSGSYVGSSGGISTYYPIPSYQQGISMAANQGSTTMRNVPDVALTADNVYVVYNNGSTGTFGGTSCAAPLWAGFTALVNQQAAAAGQAPVGFLNPALYTIGKGAKLCHRLPRHHHGQQLQQQQSHQVLRRGRLRPLHRLGHAQRHQPDQCPGRSADSAPVLVSNSFTLVAESCPNGGVDPAETVTVNFGLKNIGTANTTNLVATLLATGGILSPSGPQTYGVLITNGAAVAQPFTFTASGICGGTNTATLQLQDGAANLGTVTFSFRLGQSSALDRLLPELRRRHRPGLAGGLDHFGQRRPIRLGPVSLAGTVAYYPTNYPSSGSVRRTRVGNVTMSLTGDTNLSVVTLADGSYGLSNISVGGTYCVTPSKTDDSPTANGVDVFDLVLIQRHILTGPDRRWIRLTSCWPPT